MMYYLRIILCLAASILAAPNCKPAKHVRLCYYEDWSYYWDGNYKFTPGDIKPELCTHVIYAFAVLEKSNFESVVPLKPDLALKEGFYHQITSLKNSCITPMLGIGGEEDSTPLWFDMMNDETKRQRFVEHVTKYTIVNGFQGIDLAINYPAVWKGNLNNVKPEDKENLTKLLSELRTKFDAETSDRNERLILTLDVSATRKIIDAAYDIHALKSIVDWVTVLPNHWKSNCDDIRRLGWPFKSYLTDIGEETEYNVVSSMKIWTDYGFPPQKLVLSLPFYGEIYDVSIDTDTSVNCRENKDEKIEYMSFNKIVDTVNGDESWKVVHGVSTATYAINDAKSLIMVYDDKIDVARKALYVKQQDFLGLMVWAIDKDYFKNSPCGDYPLMSTVNDVFTGEIQDISQVKSCTGEAFQDDLMLVDE